MRDAEMISIEAVSKTTGKATDLCIPPDIRVPELISILAPLLGLSLPASCEASYVIRTQWPFGLMAGSGLVSEFRVRNGTRLLLDDASEAAPEEAAGEAASLRREMRARAGLFSPLPGRLRAGTEAGESDLLLDPARPGKRHVILERDQEEYRVIAAAGPVRIFINGQEAGIGDRLRMLDLLRIEDTALYLTPCGIFAAQGTGWQVPDAWEKACRESRSAWTYPVAIKTARMLPCLSEEPIRVLPPGPEPAPPGAGQLLHCIPALAMLAVVLLSGGMTGGAGMLLLRSVSLMAGAGVSAASFAAGRRSAGKRKKERERTYMDYISAKRREIELARAEEKKSLEQMYPGPEALLESVDAFDGTLFDRSPSDPDFMDIRIGSGNRSSTRKVETGEREQIGPADRLAKTANALSAQYEMIPDAPVWLSARRCGVIGVTGPEDQLKQLVDIAVLDLVCRQSFRDLELYILLDPEADRGLLWCRWLPHLYDRRTDKRRIICSEETRTKLLDELYAELCSRQKAGRQRERGREDRQIAVLIFRDWGIRMHPVSRFFSCAEAVGASFLFFCPHQELLPAQCAALVFLRGEGHAEICDREGSRAPLTARLPAVDEDRLEEAARKLAPVVCADPGAEAGIPGRITLFELLGVSNASELDPGGRWRREDSAVSIRIPLGVMRKGRILSLDLHEGGDGPHGLVAGTTGSGKSELLQTLLLSAALHYPPEELCFFIIDFKGGGMADPFEGLPHLAGKLTNLDGGEALRTLRFLRAELQRRQRILAGCRQNSIYGYRRRWRVKREGEPLPNLLIVVDEFAELKAQYPEFMNELISTARIGRSLGVHLILATQKPAGQVNEQIWSNSNFRICLRVQSASDSMEVLHSPLAAEIRESGRAYLQTGAGEGASLFQSAYSGAKCTAGQAGAGGMTVSIRTADGETVRVKGRKDRHPAAEEEPSQLEAACTVIREYCRKEKIGPVRQICLPPLPSGIPLRQDAQRNAAQDASGRRVLLEAGIYDDPDEQYTGPLVLDLSFDNVFFCAAPQMGKTGFLQLAVRCMAERYSAQEAEFFILDLSSSSLQSLEPLAHVRGVLLPDEEDRIFGLFGMLREEIAGRRRELSQEGAGGWQALSAGAAKKMPRLFILMENFSAFRELYEDSLGEDLVYLLREGPSCGISFIAADSRASGIGFRYLSHFGLRISGWCQDAGEYAALLGRMGLPLPELPGRCQLVRASKLYEAQLYRAFEGEAGDEKAESIRDFTERINEREKGREAPQLARMPTALTRAYFAEAASACRTAGAAMLPAGLGYPFCRPVSVDMKRHSELVITGSEPADRKKALLGAMAGLKVLCPDREIRTWIFDGEDGQLRGAAEEWNAVSYVTSPAQAEEMLRGCLKELSLPRQDKEKAGAGTEALRLIILENEETPEWISASQSRMQLCRDLCRLGKHRPFLMIYANIENESVSWQGAGILRHLKDERCMILTDPPARARFADLPPSMLRRAGNFEPGDACLLDGDAITRVKLIETEKGENDECNLSGPG